MKSASAKPKAVLNSFTGSSGSTVKTWNAAISARRPNRTRTSRGTPPAEKQMSPIRTACRRNGRRASPPNRAKRQGSTPCHAGPLPRAALSHQTTAPPAPAARILAISTTAVWQVTRAENYRISALVTFFVYEKSRQIACLFH
jgi:hypothetical protein